MQWSPAASYAKDPNDNEAVPLMHTPWNFEQDVSLAPDRELEDEDVYGAPSDDERDRHSYAQPALSSHNTSHPQRIGLNEDDVPLGSRASLDIRAAHERIIQQEKQAQSDKTLMILEGKASPRKLSDVPQRSRTMPHRRRPEPQVYDSEITTNMTFGQHSASESAAGAPLMKIHPLQRSATSVRKMGSRRKLADLRVASASVDARTPKVSKDKAAVQSQLGDVTRAMAQLSATRAGLGAQPSAQPLRVFIHNVQKYTMVPMVDNAIVISVLHQVLTQNGISPPTNTFDGWALYDVIPEWGLERPLREYERIEDIVRARGRDAGYFLMKLYDRPDLLRTDSVPPFSSVLGGSVSIRLEQGKWCKKWLELREHSLFIAKDEKSKPEGRICSMMEADLYLVNAQKVAMPKEYGFAIRHQSPEAHAIVYICQSDVAANADWVSAILRARSYVLKQERPELFLMAKSIERAEHQAAHARRAQSIHRNAELQRSRTIKTTARSPTPSTKLVPSESLEVPFEKGSLLHSIGRHRP